MPQRRNGAVERIDQDDMEILAQHLGFRGGFFNAGLKRARETKQLTQHQLGEQVKKLIGRGHSTTISSYETLREWPDVQMAEAIATVLGVEVEDIFPSWLSVYRQATAIQEIPLHSLFRLSRSEREKALPVGTVPELVEDDPVATEVTENALVDALNAQIETLPPHHAQVIRLRYLQDDGIVHTLAEVGELMGPVTHARIRQIETRALDRLRHPSRTKRLRDFLG